jgi:hypothetical protein
MYVMHGIHHLVHVYTVGPFAEQYHHVNSFVRSGAGSERIERVRFSRTELWTCTANFFLLMQRVRADYGFVGNIRIFTTTVMKFVQTAVFAEC